VNVIFQLHWQPWLEDSPLGRGPVLAVGDIVHVRLKTDLKATSRRRLAGHEQQTIPTRKNT